MMESKELKRLIACAERRNPKQFNASRERYLAEISFKAGMGEVVNFIEGRRLGGENSFSKSFLRQGDAAIYSDQWQAKKKDWGID